MTTEKDLEKRLKAMSAHTPSPVLDVGRLNRELEKQQKRARLVKMISAAAAAIVLITGAVIFAASDARRQVASVITLDSGASISVKLNQNGEVVEITAADQRGNHALKGFSNSSSSADAVTAALITHLIENGTLSEYDNTVLLTAESSGKDAEALRSDMADAVETAYADNRFSGALLSQTSDDDRTTARIASRYHISHGKAQLLRELIGADSTLSYRSLCRMNVNDLNLIADSIGLDYADITAIGSSSTLGYLAQEEAVRIAVEQLGGSRSGVRVRMDARDGELLYRLTVKDGRTTYLCNLVASSGEIITVIKNGSGAEEILVDRRSATASDQADLPFVPAQNTPVSIQPDPQTSDADVSDESNPSQPPASTEAASPADSSSQSASAQTAPTTAPSAASGSHELIPFTSKAYYSCDTDLLHAGFSTPPWETPPESSRVIRSSGLFYGNCYESTADSGQQFLSGKLVFICNTDQLNRFLGDHPHDYTDENGRSLDVSRFTDAYFKTGSLVLTAYDLQNYNYDFSITDDMRIDGGTLYINTAMSYPDDLPTSSYIAHDLCVYEIDRTDLQAVTQLRLY